MNEPIKTFECHGYTVEIHYDEHADVPEDDLIKIAYSTVSRYCLGTQAVDDNTMRGIRKGIDQGEYVGMPVYAYVHSDITIKASRTGNPFGCPWDSGQSGFVYMDTRRAMSEIGHDPAEWDKQMVRFVELFNLWANGGFTGYVIKDKDGNTVESCWGFDDQEYCEEQARASAKALQPQLELNLE